MRSKMASAENASSTETAPADAAPNHERPAPPGFLKAKAGDLYVHHGTVVRVTRVDSFEWATVINLATGATLQAALTDLRPLADAVHEVTEDRKDDPIIVNDRLDPTGKRYKRISRWVKRLTRENRPIPNSLVKKLGKRLHLGQTAFRTLISRYYKTGQVILEYKRGRVRHKKYLHERIEELIKPAIREVAAEQRDCTPAAVLKVLEVKCADLGLNPPSIKTIENRILEVSLRELAEASGHADRIKSTRLIKGRSRAVRALQEVQVDFTVADLIIVDDVYRRPLARPLLGMAIDVGTRCIPAAWLFLESPNHFTSGWIIAIAILPKSDIVRALGIEQFVIPCYGRMEKIFVDGGFRIKALIDACRRRNVGVAFRAPGECQQGGIIERLIGTFVNEMHMLHGTTYSDPLTRRRAKIDPAGLARYTLTEAFQWLYAQIHIYHHTKHRGVRDKYPIDLWMADFDSDRGMSPPALPVDPATFFIPFLWNKTPLIQREGIYLERNWYRSEDLRDWVGKRVRTYYNKTSPDVCYAEVERDRFLAIPREEESEWSLSTWCEKFLRKFPVVEQNHAKHRAERVVGRRFHGQLAQNAAAETLAARLLPRPPAPVPVDIAEDVTPSLDVLTNPLVEILDD